MFRLFVMVAFAFFGQLIRADCFRFAISKDLRSTKVLDEEFWTYVDVTENGNNTIVKVEIPAKLNFSDIFVFFANDAKEILQVKMNNKAQGTFYSTPYNKIKEMFNEEITKLEKNSFLEVSCIFSKQWLPQNFSKISATVVGLERYFNYYGMQNFKISFPDLMVIEEFKSFTHN